MTVNHIFIIDQTWRYKNDGNTLGFEKKCLISDWILVWNYGFSFSPVFGLALKWAKLDENMSSSLSDICKFLAIPDCLLVSILDFFVKFVKF